MLDRSTRKSKGFCFVSFYSVSDAMTAKNRMIAAGLSAKRKKEVGIVLREEHFSFDALLFWHMCLKFVEKTPSVKATQHLGEKITIVFFSLSNDAPYINPKKLASPLTMSNSLTVRGSQIQTRKVAVTFAKPQNQEQALESNLNAKAEQDRKKGKKNPAGHTVRRNMQKYDSPNADNYDVYFDMLCESLW